jgi:hypothetical protein
MRRRPRKEADVRNALLLVLFALLPSLCLARPEKVTATDVAEIHAVINRQIEAFSRDVARGAFALVSPEVQRAFRTPEKYLDVVRTAYRAVYRPSRIEFLDLVLLGEDVVQQLQVIDRSGGVWVAYYAMQRQIDGSWRTNGCRLVHPVRTIPA